MKKLFQYWKKIGALSLLCLLFSCETEFIPEGADLEQEIVVEGYIEAGESATPPFILLTKSVSFFNEFNPDQIEDLFVHDAEINVFDGEKNWTFTELCLDDIPEELRPIILNTLGITADNNLINLCAYIEFSGALNGAVGGQYDLTIDLPGRQLTASTTIPPHIGLEDLWFKKPSEEATDTLLELWGAVKDIPDREDFYRYFTAVNSGTYVAPFQSVVDDALFDGQAFDFIIPKAESFLDPPDIESFGLFEVGDTARIKWANLDESHYNFWSTLEFNAASQGPFSSYTQIVTNIEGGLGIWGGYSTSLYDIIVQE